MKKCTRRIHREGKTVYRRTDHTVLKEAEAGVKVSDLCRKYGLSDATYYNLKTKYAGLNVSELRRLKEFEEENRRLKQIVEEQALDNQALKELLSINF